MWRVLRHADFKSNRSGGGTLLVSIDWWKGPCGMTSRILRYLADEQPQTPCLVVDLEAVGEAYQSLHRALPMATIYYAMKANPATPVLELLAEMGA